MRDPPDEFSVDKELLDRIEAAWAESFLPRKVRAEPYKIHLYGPGGTSNLIVTLLR
jgi:hypothetical protein